MTADPRWLEILKASGPQAMAVALACGLFLAAPQWGLLPALDPWMKHAAGFGLFLGGSLALLNFLSAVLKLLPLQAWVKHRIALWRQKRDVRAYIPHMTPVEREIIAYLLAKNQKTFTAATDGGRAMTLISRGIIVRQVLPNQVFSHEQTPMGIPDHVWAVIAKHQDQFPYAPPRSGEPEIHPWREHWMNRI